MTTTANNNARTALEELKTLRDEIRLNVHLASMDLRDEWRKLERRMPDAATIADDLKAATADVLESLTLELRNFRERLRSDSTQPRP